MTISDPVAAQRSGRDLLTGDLVRLRPLDERDLPHLERWWGDPEWPVLQQSVVRPGPDYGFRALGLHRIGVEVLAFNTRGRRALEKAGYRLEGTRRESVFVDGGWSDELLLGQLRPDWEAAEEARRLVESAV